PHNPGQQFGSASKSRWPARRGARATCLSLQHLLYQHRVFVRTLNVLFIQDFQYLVTRARTYLKTGC
ncbi:unnamed protein product, partial [Amoebophrya sp. A120]